MHFSLHRLMTKGVKLNAAFFDTHFVLLFPAKKSKSGSPAITQSRACVNSERNAGPIRV